MPVCDAREMLWAQAGAYDCSVSTDPSAVSELFSYFSLIGCLSYIHISNAHDGYFNKKFRLN